MSSRIASFDALPDTAYLRESEIVRNRKRPSCSVLLPLSSPTLWRMVRAGTFPKPVKLSPRVTAWRVGDIRAWLSSHSS